MTQKTVVNAWNEWDPLKHVIVGVPDMACLPASEPALRTELITKLLFTDEALDFMEGHPEAWKHFQKHGWTKHPEPLIEEAREEMEYLVKVLEDRGIRVDRPTPIDFTQKTQTPDWVQESMFGIMPPRDIIMTVGNEIIEATMSQRSRWFEFICYRDLFEQYFKDDPNFLWTAAPKPRLTDQSYNDDFWGEYAELLTSEGGEEAAIEKFTKNETWMKTEKEPLWDAADIMRFGKDLFVQLSVKTNRAGFEWLKRYFEAKGFRVHSMLFNTSLPWHVDTTFFAARPGLFFRNATYFSLDPRFDELLKLNDWEVVDLVTPNTKTKHPLSGSSVFLAYNVFSIDPNTIMVEASQTEIMEQLAKYGIESVPVPFNNVAPFGGALHCATCDVYREGDMEDYFPKQIPGY